MAKLIFGMNVSLDGYVNYDKFDPDPVLFRHFIEATKKTAASLYGSRLYEIMAYWDGDNWDQDDPGQTEALREFALAWRAVPKWVVSKSLTSVGPNATLISGDLETEVRALKSRIDGVVDVGGRTLAHSLGQLGLIDEYHLYYHPVVLGGGDTFFVGSPPPLRLAGNERIGDNVMKLTYVPA